MFIALSLTFNGFQPAELCYEASFVDGNKRNLPASAERKIWLENREQSWLSLYLTWHSAWDRRWRLVEELSQTEVSCPAASAGWSPPPSLRPPGTSQWRGWPPCREIGPASQQLVGGRREEVELTSNITIKTTLITENSLLTLNTIFHYRHRKFM